MSWALTPKQWGTTPGFEAHGLLIGSDLRWQCHSGSIVEDGLEVAAVGGGEQLRGYSICPGQG